MRIIVVGAGMFGASAAYHLTKLGAEVVVVDEAHQGKATMAGAGIVCPWATKIEDQDFYTFYAAAGAYYPTLVADLGAAGETDFGYRKVGAMVVSEDPAELAAAEARILERTANVPEAGKVARIPASEVVKLFPPMRTDLDAILVPGAARVEARGLAAALLRVAQKNGAILRTGHVELQRDGNCVIASLDGEALEADQIVVTGGAWAPQILEPMGVRTPVAPQKGQIIHLRLEGTDTRQWPVVLPIGPHYMLAFDDSRIVIGATRETDSGFDYRITAAGEAEVLNFGLKLAPGLANATHIETRVGFRPSTTGVRPILARAPGADNLFIGNGLGAGGLTMGPLGGRILAEMALGQPTAIPVAAYGVLA